jgi:hypothetical protein
MTTGWALSVKMMPYIRKSIGDIPSKIFFDIETATFEQDTTKATDLVLKLSGGDIAVRVRNHKFGYKKYSWSDSIDKEPLAFDWSVRFVANGYKTEIHKLREGFAKWYFIGLANKDETDLFDYGLIDLNRCRINNIFRDELWQINPNSDGTAGGYLRMRRVKEYGCLLWHKTMKLETYIETPSHQSNAISITDF